MDEVEVGVAHPERAEAAKPALGLAMLRRALDAGILCSVGDRRRGIPPLSASLRLDVCWRT